MRNRMNVMAHILTVLLVTLFFSCSRGDDKGQANTPKPATDQSYELSARLEMEKFTDNEFIKEGNKLFANREFEKAIDAFTKAIEQNPKEEIAYKNRGVTYAGLAKYEEAISDFTKALELNEKASTYFYRASMHYTIKKDDQRVFEDCSRAIELQPDYAEAYLFRAISGKSQNAREDLEKASRLGSKEAKILLEALNAKRREDSAAKKEFAQTKPQVEEIKDYNGIPWGIDFDKFQEIKKNVNKPTWKGKYFISEKGENRDALIAICLGAHVKNDWIGLRLTDYSLFPENFFYVYNEEIYYIFYDNKFAMVFTSISNYDDVYNKLSQTCSKGNTIADEYTNLKNVRTLIQMTATQFRKGNQSSYLIKMTENDMITFTSGYLLIIPDKFYNLLKKDMDATQNERTKKATEYKEKEVQKDFNKLR